MEGIANLNKLDTIQLKRNRIGKTGDVSTAIEDLEGLLECPSLACLDISDNYIEDPEVLP